MIDRASTKPHAEIAAGSNSYAYRQLGGIDTITYPNGTVVDYGFNNETEQPVSLTVDGATVASGVRYNPAGQVEFIQRGQPDWTSADLDQLGTTYSYDFAQRISSISTAGLDEADATEDALIRLFRSAFDRDPDAAGWGYWLPQYADGLPLANIAQVFHDSAEFPTTWTDTDGTTVRTLSNNFDFVMWMYGHIIDRAMGNRSGWSWWQTQLDTGAWTRGQAIDYFSSNAGALSNPDIGGTDATTPYVAPNPADADIPQQLAYTWDDAGNLTKIHETSEGVDQWQCFTYDNLHRLDLGYIHGSSACGAYQAIGPDPFNVDYGYDSIGNITTAAGTGTVSGSYTYSSTKPHAVTAAGSNSYAYDPSGNMTTRTTTMGTQNLVYDVLNRLVEISGAGDDMDALYDADGVRVRRDLDGDTVFYLTDDYEIHDPAVGANSETIHFTLGGVTVGSDIDGTLYVSASDHLGSGSISRDNTGATTTQRYTPYGAIRGGGGNGLPTDFTFTGQTDDPGTGLIDYNARHYDPQLGRFIMADPILDGLNRYTYVQGNPLRYVDPSGNCSESLRARFGTNAHSLGHQCAQIQFALNHPGVTAEHPYPGEIGRFDLFRSDSAWNPFDSDHAWEVRSANRAAGISQGVGGYNKWKNKLKRTGVEPGAPTAPSIMFNQDTGQYNAIFSLTYDPFFSPTGSVEGSFVFYFEFGLEGQENLGASYDAMIRYMDEKNIPESVRDGLLRYWDRRIDPNLLDDFWNLPFDSIGELVQPGFGPAKATKSVSRVVTGATQMFR